MTYAYDICIWLMHMTYAYDICIWHMHMTYAHGICKWHMHMQETQNAEKYSFGNESGLGGPVWAQIWSESIPAESRKPLKPFAGSKTAIKKSKIPKIPKIRKSENFLIFPIWEPYMGALYGRHFWPQEESHSLPSLGP